MKKIYALLMLLVLTGCSNPASQQIKKGVSEVNDADSSSSSSSSSSSVDSSSADGSDISLAGLTFVPGKLPGELDGKQFYSTQSDGTSLRFSHTSVERKTANKTESFDYQVDFDYNRIIIHAASSDVAYEIMVSNSDVVMFKLVDYVQEGNAWPMMFKGRIASG